MANENLGDARKSKQDEFYTQFHDIEKEMNAYLDFNKDVFRDKTILLPCDDPEWSNFTKFFAKRFEAFGIKKLISTSYAPNSKPKDLELQPTLFELESPLFDEAKSVSNGKIFTLTRDLSGDGRIDVDDLEWKYLEGDGDFRSDEIRALRDEADIIITNPPFSLFREFLTWMVEAGKQFVMIGNMNAITYKEVFPLIRDSKLWLGNGFQNGNAYFASPTTRDYADGVFDESTGLVKFRNVIWLTNLDHGRRHQPMPLMTQADNIKFSNHKEVKGVGYRKYDNYDAIEVPFTDAIPSDYPGLMGVPISFLDKFNPDQFEILGITQSWDDHSGLKKTIYPVQTQVSSDGRRAQVKKLNDGAAILVDETPNSTYYIVDGKKYVKTYARFLIRHKKAQA